MIYKPDSLSPAGVAFDATQPIVFSWVLYGTGISGVTVEVADNLTGSVVTTFDDTTLAGFHEFIAGTFVNGTDYQWRVMVTDGIDTVYSDWQVVQCQNVPIAGLAVDPIVTNQSMTFSGVYYQAQGVPLRQYQFFLYSDTGVLIDSSPIKIDGLLTHTFRLASNEVYQIELRVVSMGGLTGTTGMVSFSTDFTVPMSTVKITAEQLPATPVAKISWLNPMQILGQFTGDTPTFIDGKFGQALELKADEKVTFSYTLPSTFTLTHYVKLPNGFSGTILRLQATNGDFYVFGYDGVQKRFFISKSVGLVSRIAASPIIELPSDYLFYAIRNGVAMVGVNGDPLIKFE